MSRPRYVSTTDAARAWQVGQLRLTEGRIYRDWIGAGAADLLTIAVLLGEDIGCARFAVWYWRSGMRLGGFR